MGLTLLLGGARAGKSSIAVEAARFRQGSVAVIVTAEAHDDEMADRIRQHQARRPAEWETVEEPLDLESALTSIPTETTALVDCLTLWVSNLIAQGLPNEEIEARAHAAAKLASSRTAETIVVSNEVGSGIVPINALARRYRDLLGRVNAIWADASDRTALVVAGRLFPLSRPDELWGSH